MAKAEKCSEKIRILELGRYPYTPHSFIILKSTVICMASLKSRPRSHADQILERPEVYERGLVRIQSLVKLIYQARFRAELQIR